MKPGDYRGETISGFTRFRFFLQLFLVMIILSLLFSSFPALGGNPQTVKNKETKLRDDWIKGDGVHYLGLNPPAPGAGGKAWAGGFGAGAVGSAWADEQSPIARAVTASTARGLSTCRSPSG